MAKTFNRAIKICGEPQVVGDSSTSLIVDRYDTDSRITRAHGATVPTDADAGYAVGCVFIDTDSGAGATFYVNEGSTTSCDFNVTGTTGDINADELDPIGDGAFGVPIVIQKSVASLAAAGTNIVTTHKKMRILDAWFVATSADSGDITVHAGQVGAIGTAITDTITVAAADKGISRAATIDDAVWDMAEDGGLVAVGDGGASIDGVIFVLAIRID